jgi:hypothetical protein
MYPLTCNSNLPDIQPQVHLIFIPFFKSYDPNSWMRIRWWEPIQNFFSLAILKCFLIFFINEFYSWNWHGSAFDLILKYFWSFWSSTLCCQDSRFLDICTFVISWSKEHSNKLVRSNTYQNHIDLFNTIKFVIIKIST